MKLDTLASQPNDCHQAALQQIAASLREQIARETEAQIETVVAAILLKLGQTHLDLTQEDVERGNRHVLHTYPHPWGVTFQIS